LIEEDAIRVNKYDSIILEKVKDSEKNKIAIKS
jgi:hypothetical protein